MTRLRAMLFLPVLILAFCTTSSAQTNQDLKVHSVGGFRYDRTSGLLTYTNDVAVKHPAHDLVLTADSVSINEKTCEVVADGNVRIQQGDQTWVGDHISCNFTNNILVADHFRTGKYPVFAAADGLRAEATNEVDNVYAGTNAFYTATNAFITTDDIATPASSLRPSRIRIYPDQRIEARHATLRWGNVPVFYLPYYSRRLGVDVNNFNVTPGYRSAYGPFVLGSYNWLLNTQFNGAIHLDYRNKRGVGTGADVNYDLGRWGAGSLRYYYTHDRDPETNSAINELYTPLYENRQRVVFSYLAAPATNLEVRSVVRYQNDFGVIHDFFAGEYRQNPQPNSYLELNKSWQNFSLDLLAQPRINNFYETVERLPEARLTGFRQQVSRLPVFYESESSAGFYRRLFAETNSPAPPDNYDSVRADTFHQLTAPITLFGWLNLIPRVGGRFTYYGEVNGLYNTTGQARTNADTTRGAFNTGAELTFKASRLWPGVRNQLLDLDGVRHVLQPSANYVYVPTPNYEPNELPQFDSELPSLRMLPNQFPQYNSIDSIDSQDVIRLGLGNKLQTKRQGQVQDLLKWEVFSDWRLTRQTIQETNRQDAFSDIYSDLTLRPRSWLTLQSQTRFDPNDAEIRMSLQTFTLEPNNIWSWTCGQFYLRDESPDSPTGLGGGNSLLTSTLYYRMNENWGVRASHHYDLRNSRMQEQFYTLYRDLRSWTVALRGGVRENSDGETDWSVTFTFSLKAMPRFGLGSDTVRRQSLLGE